MDATIALFYLTESMSLLEIIILALIQGLTEFLPISSSAHLLLPAEVFGWQTQGLAFDVAVHLGSLIAVVGYFRQDLLNMARAWLTEAWRPQQSADSRLAWLVIVATIPAVVFGLLAKDWIEVYARTSLVIAMTTILFGLLLWYADRTASQQNTLSKLSLGQAVLIGLAQAVALIPGTSRSGITMTVALLLGYDRQSAARFSFLLSVPVILGASLFLIKDLLTMPGSVDWLSLSYGVIFSCLAAYACITLFLRWINRIGMLPFVVYRLALGLILLGLIVISG